MICKYRACLTFYLTSCHIMLFLVSTVFHTYSFLGSNHRLKELLHRCDRAMIYIFIAGAYTPWIHLKVCTLYLF